MNILFFTPGAVGFTSPSVKMAEELSNRGHNISCVVGDINRIITDGDFDVVWADFEGSVIQGFVSSKCLDVPIYAHVEWIPPYRVQQTNKWGPGCILNHSEIDKFRAFYKPIAVLARECDICSYADQECVDFAEEFIDGRKYDNYFIRYPELPPEEEMPKMPIPISEAEHAVAIVGRIAPNKRVPELIKAVGNMDLKDKPKIYVVGEGGERQTAYAIARQHELDIEFAGATDGDDKWDFIAKSRVLLAAWSGIPPGEALMCGRPTIAFDYNEVRNIYGDSIIYTEKRTAGSMARKLDEVFTTFNGDLEEFVLKGIQHIENGEIGLNTFERQVDKIEKTLKSLVEGG